MLPKNTLSDKAAAYAQLARDHNDPLLKRGYDDMAHAYRKLAERGEPAYPLQLTDAEVEAMVERMVRK